MANGDAFSAAVQAFTLFNAYVNTVGEEIGPEKAAGLVGKTFEKMAVQQGRIMKEQSRIEGFDARSAFLLLLQVPESLGIPMEIVEETPQRVVAKCSLCSIYEAGKQMGLSPETIEHMCRAGPGVFMDTAAKQLNPGLTFQLRKFRSGRTTPVRKRWY